MRDFQMYPKWKYKEGESPRLVNTHVEEADLGDTWTDKPDGTNHAFDQEEAATSATPPGYVAVEYPKWRYSREYPGGRVVNSFEEENALPGVEWFDKPDFTNSGEPSTDTTAFVSTSGVRNPPFDALGGPNVLAPVPEMQQGAARTRASNVAEMDDGEDFSALDNPGDKQPEENVPAAGEAENDFDHANGVNPGDAAPEGENPNGPTGKVTKPATEKQTAEEVKSATPAKKKTGKKDADDLL